LIPELECPFLEAVHNSAIAGNKVPHPNSRKPPGHRELLPDPVSLSGIMEYQQLATGLCIAAVAAANSQSCVTLTGATSSRSRRFETEHPNYRMTLLPCVGVLYCQKCVNRGDARTESSQTFNSILRLIGYFASLSEAQPRILSCRGEYHC